MRTISSDKLEENISRFNTEYFCTIEKILLWPDKIRIYIDECGDDSLGQLSNQKNIENISFYHTGSIQDPMTSTIAFIEENDSHLNIKNRILVDDSRFLIEDETSQYLGKIYLKKFIYLFI